MDPPFLEFVPRCFPHMHVLRLSFLPLSVQTIVFVNDPSVLVKLLRVLLYLRIVVPRSRIHSEPLLL